MKRILIILLSLIAFNTFAFQVDTTQVNDLMDKMRNARSNGKYDSSVYYSKRVISLPFIKDWPNMYAKATMYCAEDMLSLNLFDDADSLLLELEDFFTNHEVPNKALAAELLRSKGDVLNARGQLAQAKLLYEEGLSKLLKVDNDYAYRQRGQFYNTLGIAAARMSDFGLSSDYFQSSLAVYDSIKNMSRVAAINNNLGNLYQLMGSYNLSAEHYLKALKIKQERLGNDHYSLSYTYTSLAGLYVNLEENNKAKEYLQRAIDISVASAGPTYEGIEHNHLTLAGIYADLGEFENAWEAITIAETVMKKRPQQKLPDQAILAFTKGFYYNKTKEARKSIDQFIEAIGYYSKMGDRSPIDIARCRVNIASNYSILGELDKAIADTRVGIDLFKKIYGPRHQDISKSLNRIAVWLNEQGKPEEALAVADECIASAVFLDDTGNIDLNRVIHRNQLMYGLLLKGDLLLNTYAEDSDINTANQAMNYYLYADSLVNIKQQFESYADQLGILDTLNGFYDHVVELKYRLYENENNTQYINEAFKYANRSNNVLLRHREKQSKDKKFGNVPTTIVDMELQLKENISYIKSQIFNLSLTDDPGNQEAITRFEGRLFDKNRRLDSLKQAIQQSHPNYFNFMYGIDQPSLDELSDVLDANTTFVQYVTTQKNIFAFKLHVDTRKFVKLPIEAGFDKTLTEYLNLLSAPEQGSLSKHIEVGAALYDMLIRPLGTLNEEVVILADGKLNLLPFETLVNRDLLNNEEGLPYMIGAHNISYRHLASQLITESAKARSKGKMQVLAMAPAYQSNSRGANPVQHGELMALTWNSEEVEGIKDLYDTELFLNKSATESNFRKNSNEKGILHIASHALLNEEDPLSSRIVFEKDATDSVNDGSLFVHELYNMTLDAKLVVLSACNTGAGEIANGEGIMSLGRGFMYAGVNSVLLSHWQVNDKSTRDIMKYFHQNLAAGQSKSEALRNAKLEFIASGSNLTSHPFFWGSFVVIGDDEPLVAGNDWVKYWFVLLIPLIWLAIRKKRQAV